MSHVSPNKNGPHWPPRSPHEALQSTPKGRERLRLLAERDRSPSPSPTKRSRPTRRLLAQDVELDDDDDEEILQLKLQEIQTRLKIKAAQKAKSLQGNRETEDTSRREAPRALSRPNSSLPNSSRPNSVADGRSFVEEIREQRRLKKTSDNIEVPASPVRKARPVEEHSSPKRVLLGIDKGIKASEISLRRAPNLRKDSDPFHNAGNYMQRSTSRPSSFHADVPRSNSIATNGRPKSFSERMAQVRTEEVQRREKDAKIKGLRSTGFGIDQKQVELFKRAAKDIPEEAYESRPPEFSRHEIVSAYSQASSAVGAVGRSISTSAIQSRGNRPTTMSTTQSFPPPSTRVRKKQVDPSEVSESEASIFEPYSSVHLSKRIIPHSVLTREFTDRNMFLIPSLLTTIKAPDFASPDVEGDFVVMGIIAAKSEPLEHKTNVRGDVKKGKFMIMTICDLKWELQLYLFNAAFDQFWKLTPGTVIAILNPGVMPPAQNRSDTGKFNLKLASDADTILEIGNARDLGFCKSVKKDGKVCNSWIDKRHTEFCDYHVNLTLSKTKAGRMEVNTMNGGKGWKDTKHVNMNGWQERKKNTLDKSGTTYDRQSQSQIFISKGTGIGGGASSAYTTSRSRSAASMLDDPDVDPDAFHRGYSKEERQRRRLAEHEKERDIREKLGSIGGGIGADYMRRQSQNSYQPQTHSQPEAPPPPDAAALGLLASKGTKISLSPMKRKRKIDGSVSSEARGWGADLSKDLAKMRDGESLTAQQPVRKKTRFVTASGIKEAGRESLGGPVDGEDDDDDDDLDIV